MLSHWGTLGFPPLLLGHYMGQTPTAGTKPSCQYLLGPYSLKSSLNRHAGKSLRATWGPERTMGFIGQRPTLSQYWDHSCPLVPSMGPHEALPCHFHSGAQWPSCRDLPRCGLPPHWLHPVPRG